MPAQWSPSRPMLPKQQLLLGRTVHASISSGALHLPAQYRSTPCRAATGTRFRSTVRARVCCFAFVACLATKQMKYLFQCLRTLQYCRVLLTGRADTPYHLAQPTAARNDSISEGHLCYQAVLTSHSVLASIRTELNGWFFVHAGFVGRPERPCTC